MFGAGAHRCAILQDAGSGSFGIIYLGWNSAREEQSAFSSS